MSGIFSLLLLVGFVGLHWKWFVAAAAVWWVVRYAQADLERGRRAAADRRQRDADLAARADQQHAWAIGGDPRGTFGEFPPV